jgi:hypothetical protein
MTTATPGAANAYTPTEPTLFRLEIQWQGPPMDHESVFFAQGIVDTFLQRPKVLLVSGPLANKDFAATYALPPLRMAQLLQCLSTLRPLRARYTLFTPSETVDDVNERLFGTQEWSYYPDPDRVARALEVAEAKKKPARRFAGF